MKRFILITLSLIIFNFSEAQKLKKLGIEFDSDSYNFGDIQMWENQPAIFSLTNKSKQAISILPLFSESDLEIIYPEQAIQPGETAIIKAIYYTSGTGSFSRKFPIYFNLSPEAYELKISGNIKSLSPTAYIQCPQAKPEHSKTKVELFGNVSEIETEIPLNGSVIKIVSLTSKNNLIFYADKNGNFSSNLPTGNYEVFVEHPNYHPHQSFFYLGQTSGNLKVRLTPLAPEPILAHNTPLPKETPNNLEKKQGELNNTIAQNSLEKVPNLNTTIPTKNQSLEEENLDNKEGYLNSNLKNTDPEKANTFDVNEVIPYPKNTPTETITPKSTDTTPRENHYTHPVNSHPVSTPDEDKRVYETTEVIKPKENYYNSTPTKEITPTPPLAINTKKYTIRIIDEKTFEPISEAFIYANPTYTNTKTIKLKSDELGMSQIPLEKEDYKVIVNADNYISGEINIKADQEDEIIRVYLSPVSNLFEDIYAAKKKENSGDELLNHLSFGKTELSFGEQDKTSEKAPPTPNNITEEPTTPIQETEFIAENLPPSPSSIPSPEQNKNQLNVDSIQRIIAEIEAEKLKIELELAKKELELSKKEALLAQQESELAKKDYELGNKTNELEQVKNNFNETQEALEKQKLALDEIAKKEAKETEEAPVSLELSKEEYKANNVLFLIDISSSMGKENKMELLKESIKSLALVLRDIDRVAIIAYNQNATVVLESVSGADKSKIIQTVDSLQTSGLTYGVNGLQTAYELLEYNYIGTGNNQIILATDGLFSSVNNSMSENELNKEVRKQVNENNIKLSVIGFGQDENGDKLMEKLAGNGSGQFIKIKNPWQAKTVLVDEIKINSKL